MTSLTTTATRALQNRAVRKAQARMAAKFPGEYRRLRERAREVYPEYNNVNMHRRTKWVHGQLRQAHPYDWARIAAIALSVEKAEVGWVDSRGGKTHDAKRWDRQVPCDFCGALAQQPCRQPNGHAGPTHKVRQNKAREAEAA